MDGSLLPYDRLFSLSIVYVMKCIVFKTKFLQYQYTYFLDLV